MTPFDLQFKNALLARVEEERRARAEHLADGRCADWADYKYRTGFLLALTEMVSWCEETAKQIAER